MAWVSNFKKYDTSNGFGNAKKWRNSFYERISDKEAIEILAAQDDTPYSILGITESATQAEIKKAFRALIIKWHPDKNQDNILQATEMSKKIIAAYTILNNS